MDWAPAGKLWVPLLKVVVEVDLAELGMAMGRMISGNMYWKWQTPCLHRHFEWRC